MPNLDWLTDIPRTTLGHWPTPLEPLPNLSRELGGPTIWLKRDDCSGLATGGNKTRKLEYLIGAAVADRADTIITFGAVQSNHARQTAAAAAKVGLDCHLILIRLVAHSSPNYESGGNILLDSLFGAQLHFLDAHEDVKAYTKNLLARLTASGKKVYSIPTGGSNHIGALGYVQCAEEIIEQCEAQKICANTIIHASSSAGTQAGLLFGLSCLNSQIRVIGINVYHSDPSSLHKAVAALGSTLMERYGDLAEVKSPGQVEINHAYFGEGYGQPTQETIQAIHTVAESEGILFDPVYSGKALAATIDQINIGNFADEQDIILIHTGGAAVLNVYHQNLGYK
ncbi:MAG: D-cysteine desulfhydrase family protein [Gammaproteobacteria bacterium]|nr:D-cysteine desulfhydrase family protein [Gammaproteobacteria bacterium]